MRRLAVALLFFAATTVSAQLPKLTWVRQFRSQIVNDEFVRVARQPTVNPSSRSDGGSPVIPR